MKQLLRLLCYWSAGSRRPPSGLCLGCHRLAVHLPKGPIIGNISVAGVLSTNTDGPSLKIIFHEFQLAFHRQPAMRVRKVRKAGDRPAKFLDFGFWPLHQ